MPPKNISQKRDRHAAHTKQDKKQVEKPKPEAHEDEAAFPRGGAELLSKQERLEIEAQAKAELDQELETGAGLHNKKQNKGGKDTADGLDVEDSFLRSSALAGKVPQYVELLKFKKLVVGMRMWGMVLEVTPKGLHVSLPDGLRGTVVYEEACDFLHKNAKEGAGAIAAQQPSLMSLFSVGQFVRCVVVGLQQGATAQGGRGGKTVELSCRVRRVIAPGTLDRSSLIPGIALPSEVKVELDHGWTLSFGHKGFEGFLPRAQHKAAFGEDATLSVGQLQEVVVQSAPDARGVVAVTTHPGAVADALTSESAGLSLESLLPGALVNARVRRVQGDGLLVTFLTFFHGTVDPFHLHLPGKSSTKSGEAGTTKGFTEGMKVKARILYTNPTSKEVGLSLLPHLLNMTLPSPVPRMGQVFESARVLRVDKGLGVMLELPQEGMDACKGFCHISNLSNERLPNLDAAYQVGTSTVRCRVIGFNLMDGLALMSARKAVVEQQVLSYTDVVPGMSLSGTLYSVDDPMGLWVSIAKNVRALVPAIHLPDASSAQKARSKFKAGQTVTGRVLAVDAPAKKMSLTLKPGLLTSKLPLIVSPQQAVSGAKAHGIVTGVKDDKGVFLSFYGGVTSLAPLAELGLPEGAAATAFFHPGQVVRARVTSIDSHGRPRCSLKAGKGVQGSDAAATPNGAQAKEGRVLQIGDIVETATVRSIMEPSTSTAPQQTRAGGALILDIPSAPGVSARLDLRGHLADHPAAEAVLRPLLAKPGAQLGPLVVLERLESSGKTTLVLSRKPSLVQAASSGQLPHSFEEVKEGAMLQGFVANVTHDGVFVRFAGHTTGRAGLSQVADSFVADPRQLFTEGQSVRAQVVTVDAAHGRFSVTLRPSLTASTDGSYLVSMFSDLDLAEQIRTQQTLDKAKAEGSTEVPSSVVDWSRLQVGSMTPCMVSELAPYGVVVDLDVNEDLVGVIRPPHFPSAPAPAATGKCKPNSAPLPAPGTKMSCRILDVSQAEGIVDLSARPDLLAPLNSQLPPASTPSKRRKGVAKAEKEGGEGHLPPQGSVQEAVVEVVQGAPSHYAVVSLPQLPGSPLASVPLTDFNAPTIDPARRAAGVAVGERVKVIIAVAPSPSTSGRLLAVMPSLFGGKIAVSSAGGEAVKQSVQPGSVVSVRVAGVGSSQADLVVGKKLPGRVHVSQVRDVHIPQGHQSVAATPTTSSSKKRKKSGDMPVPDTTADSNGVLDAHLWHGTPLDVLSVGQQLEAVVLGRGGANNHGVLELSIRPSVLEAAKQAQPLPAQPSFGSLQPGMVVGCVVSEIADDHAWLSLSPGVRGRLYVLDSDAQPQQVAAFGQRFKVGDGVVARVVSVNAKKQLLDFTLLPPLHGASRLVPAAAITAAVAAGRAAVVDALPAGSLVMGRLSRIQGGLRVQLGSRLHGNVALSDVHDVYVANALEGLQEGSFVRARVLGCGVYDGSCSGVDSRLPRVTLSLRPSDGGAVPEAAAKAAVRALQEGAARAPPVLPEDQITTSGAAVCGYVKKVEAKQGMFVSLDRSHDARVKMCNLSDGFIEDPVAAFPEGLSVSGHLMAAAPVGSGSASQQQRLEMTLRSAGGSSKASAGLKVLSDFKEGEVVAGRIKRVEKFGVFVELEGSNVAGLAHISELLDTGKVKNIHGLFRQNQIVRTKVVSIDLGAGRMSLTLKPSEVGEQTDDGPSSKRQKREAGLDEEMADAEDSDEDELRGQRHKRNAGSSSESDEDESGDEDADAETGGQQRDHTTDGPGVDDLDDSDSEEGGSVEETEEGANNKGDNGSDDGDAEIGSGSGEGEELQGMDLSESQGVSGSGTGSEGLGEGEGSGSDREESNEEEQPASRRASHAASASRLARDAAGAEEGGWGPGLKLAEDQQEQAAGNEGQKGGGGKTSRAAKKRAKEEREEAIERAEQARLQGDSAPSSPAEFEVLLRSSPNSSYVWIRYMAFLLGLGEADKARAVAQRALQTIYYREESEKFNVWVALLNLEAAHGLPSPDEALMSTFSKAAPYCDQKRLYFALLGILRRPTSNPGRPELLSNTLRAMTKKFSTSAKVWLAAHEATLTGATHEGGNPDPEAARKLLDRALTSLPKRKHIKVIVQTALHEFKCPGGSAERGRGVLESVLRNHPKRIDLWSLYIDQEVKAKDEGRTRALFERITSLPLPARKMKPIFKRWLNWEKAGSDATRVEYVKKRAMEFVEATAK